MAHKRNVEGLLNNAAKKKQQVLQRADEAIRLLLKEGRSVTFRSVAKAGGISIPYLYKNKILRERIERLREQNQSTAATRKFKASDSAKDSIIVTLRERIKEIQKENQELKKQMEIAYGRIVALENNMGR